MARTVPYAADALGALIDPTEVTGRGPFCLQCKEPVSLRREHFRKGHEVGAHFFHPPGNPCGGERMLHIAAKMHLREALTLCERPARRPAPTFGYSVNLPSIQTLDREPPTLRGMF